MNPCFLLQSLHSLLRFYKTLKSHFFFLKLYFSPQKLLFLNFQNQDVLWGAQVICHWGCQWLIWMPPRDGFSFHIVSFTTCCIPATFVTSLLLLNLPGFTQHMPPCETCRLRGTVFQLHPETSFDIRGLPFHMSQTLLLVFFLGLKTKMLLFS